MDIKQQKENERLTTGNPPMDHYQLLLWENDELRKQNERLREIADILKLSRRLNEEEIDLLLDENRRLRRQVSGLKDLVRTSQKQLNNEY